MAIVKIAATKQLTAQASGTIHYDLHSLGWRAFQDLCSTILRELLGQTIETFFDSNDGGRDGAFNGTWKPKGGEAFRGTFCMQCKFTAKGDKRLAIRDIQDELVKARRLGKKGLAQNYILITNHRITGVVEEQLRSQFLSINGIRRFAAYGSEWISQSIHESPRLRMLVPRVYGLGDLSQILDERAYDQAIEILSSLGDDLSKFVITDAYRRSANALHKYGFVQLLGEPSSGKSTIAAALAVGAIDQWRCKTLTIRSADEFVSHWNPNDSQQFFWIDDVFGATQFELTTADQWNRAFPHMKAAIKRGAKIIFTSRDYIFRAAQHFLKTSAFPLIEKSRVTIHVEKLSVQEREQILYNHIRLGNQRKSFRTAIKPYLRDTARHANFKPEIARRLGDQLFTRKLGLHEDAINRFVEFPTEHLVEIINTLDEGNRAALAMVFMREGKLAAPINLTNQEVHAAKLIGAGISDIRKALNALSGSLILNVLDGGKRYWKFKHPTIRDAFANLVANDVELLDIYLAGTSVEKLIHEISCGNVRLQGVKVVVPSTHFATVSMKLSALLNGDYDSHAELSNFLSYRCVKGFLNQFVKSHPTILDRLRVRSFLSTCPDIRLFAKLHSFGLLPESKRKYAVGEMCRLAIETPDPEFLDEPYRNLFTKGEMEYCIQQLRDELLPRLNDYIDEWRFCFSDYIDDPESHPLTSALCKYKTLFSKRSRVITKFDTGIAKVRQAIENSPPDDEEAKKYGDVIKKQPVKKEMGRSIFDDVDQ